MKDAKGHGSNAKPIPGHTYHFKTNDELRYIQKDASEAARAMRGFNSGAEGKYLDQVNDASTVLGYRDRGGKSQAPADQLSSGTSKSDPAPVHDAMSSATHNSNGHEWGSPEALKDFSSRYGTPKGFARGQREINELKRRGK